MHPTKTSFSIGNMHCRGCEHVLENSLGTLPGVFSVEANYAKGVLTVTHDPERIDRNTLLQSIREAGYLADTSGRRAPYFGLAVLAVMILALGLWFHPGGALKNMMQHDVTLGLLFLVGLLTGVHCVGMCGGMMLACLPTKTDCVKAAFLPSVTYNITRCLCYALTGTALGAIGGTLSVTPNTRAGIMIFSAILMIAMGLNMLGLKLFGGVFSWKARWTNRLKTCSPVALGILTAFFPCGPLQMIQVYALGTGSALAGGLGMLIFALGTVPAMMAVGISSSLIRRRYDKLLLNLTGLLIVVLGLMLLKTGAGKIGLHAG